MEVKEFREKFEKKLKTLGFRHYEFKYDGFYKFYQEQDIITYQPEYVRGTISFTWASQVSPVQLNVEFPSTNDFNSFNGGIKVFDYPKQAIEFIDKVKPVIKKMQRDLELLKPILEESRGE